MISTSPQLQPGRAFPGASAATRGAALRASGIEHLPPQDDLLQVVELAAEICGVPVGALSFLDERWQTVLASVGLPIEQVARESSFCTHTLHSGDLMLVEDTMKDVRFIGHPMVTGDPEVRFYAGLPIQRPGDKALIGTLCVVDTRPHVLSRTQLKALRALGAQFETKLQLLQEREALQCALAERKQAHEALVRREALFRAYLENGPLLTYLKDEQSRLLFYNRRLAEQFRISQTEWLGKTDAEFLPADQAAAIREHDLLAFGTRGVVEREEVVGVGSEHRTYMSYKFACDDENGRRMLAGMSIDVTDQRQQEQELAHARQELEKLSTRDELTGLGNRRLFEERLDQEYLKASAGRRPLALVIVDMDLFAQRNERMGDQAGDDALQRAGAVLSACISETDIAVRYGADEFTILMPETTVEEAKAFAERYQRKLRQQTWGLLPLTVSIGLACTQHAARSARQLFCFADEAMYRAKDLGRDRIVVYSPRQAGHGVA